MKNYCTQLGHFQRTSYSYLQFRKYELRYGVCVCVGSWMDLRMYILNVFIYEEYWCFNRVGILFDNIFILEFENLLKCFICFFVNDEFRLTFLSFLRTRI